MALDEWWRDYAVHAFVTYAQNIKSDDPATLQDREAVERLFEILKREDKTEIADAIKMVYFTEPNGTPDQKDVVKRVESFAKSQGVPSKRVYMWLKSSRLLYAKLRGLHTGIDDEKKR